MLIKFQSSVLLEAYNIMRHISSEQIHEKWTNIDKRNITNNDLKVPEKPKLKCLGFTYSGAKLFNMVPLQMRETRNPNGLKTMSKDWIWKNIPSYQSISLLLSFNKSVKILCIKSRYTMLYLFRREGQEPIQ